MLSALIFRIVALLTTSRSIICSIWTFFFCCIVLLCALTNVLKLNACRIKAYFETEDIFACLGPSRLAAGRRPPARARAPPARAQAPAHTSARPHELPAQWRLPSSPTSSFEPCAAAR
jgi:hypothetical protein